MKHQIKRVVSFAIIWILILGLAAPAFAGNTIPVFTEDEDVSYELTVAMNKKKNATISVPLYGGTSYNRLDVKRSDITIWEGETGAKWIGYNKSVSAYTRTYHTYKP